MMMQARGFLSVVSTYSGMPVPPAGDEENVLSAEAREQFEAGEGGPLATNPGSTNGIYGPPLGMWRAGSMMSYIGFVRHSQPLCT